jgi:hypothetical protein
VDTRKAMVVGGGATVVATVAVAAAIAWTSAAALSDSPGAPLAAGTVVVPSPTVAPTASPAPSTSATTTVSSPAPTPVTVPAPEPGIVESHSSTTTKSSTNSSNSSPSTKPSQSARPSDAPQSKWHAWENGRALVAAAVKSGDWSKVRAWARSLGWSEKQISAWIAVWQHRYDSGRTMPPPPATSGKNSGSDHPSSDSGSKRERSDRTPN